MQVNVSEHHPALPRSGRAGGSEDGRRLRQELRQAVRDQDFALAFMPRLSLKDGRPHGIQARLRWPRRRGGVTPASVFMPLLDEGCLAGQVTAWALAEACRAAAARRPGLMAIGLPGWSPLQGQLLAQIGQALAESGLPPEQLEIELAEPALGGDATEVMLALAALRDIGVGLALDEFGGGSANLLTLRNLPMTTLSLDRTLVRDLPDDRDAAAVALASIDYAHALGVTVVACGVDNAAQRAFLRRAGCDVAQGAAC